VLARQHKSKINIPSKKALAAKARRKAANAPKHIYHKEQMPLMDALAVLRVGPFIVVRNTRLAQLIFRLWKLRNQTLHTKL
jgi:hypothetical protein